MNHTSASSPARGPAGGPFDTARLTDLLTLACSAADAARVVTLSAFRRPLAVHDKSGGASEARPHHFDPVTDTDRAAQVCIRDALRAGAPDIGFLGEEADEAAAARSAAPDDPCWIVDPIDGTRAFIAGMPLWGTLIALRVDGRAALGVLDQPALRERYSGGPEGAFQHVGNERHVLSTHRDATLATAVLCCTTPAMFDADDRARFERVERAVRITRFGTDCYGYAMLAAGHVDLVIEADLSSWDVQALIPVVRGAGGVITTWEGGAPDAGGAIVAAGSAALHRAALDLLGRP